jgi:hypothetical protein
MKETNNQIQLPAILQEIPSKKEISNLIQNFVHINADPILKYCSIKALEEYCKQYIEQEKNSVKKEFLKQFNGVTKQEVYGVEISLKDYSKSAMLRDYKFSYDVTTLEKEIALAKDTLKLKEDMLKKMKMMEINNSIAKPILDPTVFGEPDTIDNWQMFITLRKE